MVPPDGVYLALLSRFLTACCKTLDQHISSLAAMADEVIKLKLCPLVQYIHLPVAAVTNKVNGFKSSNSFMTCEKSSY